MFDDLALEMIAPGRSTSQGLQVLGEVVGGDEGQDTALRLSGSS